MRFHFETSLMRGDNVQRSSLGNRRRARAVANYSGGSVPCPLRIHMCTVRSRNASVRTRSEWAAGVFHVDCWV